MICNLSTSLVTKERTRFGDYSSIRSIHAETPTITSSFSTHSFVTRPVINDAGYYCNRIILPEPVFGYHAAITGTTRKFKGAAMQIFKDVKISEDVLDNISRERDTPDSSDI